MRQKNVSTKLLIKSGFWYTVTSFLTRAIGFITVPVFSRLMTKEEFGDFSVYANWQQILLIVCGLELYATLNRARFDYTGEKEFDEYISSSLFLSTVVTGAVFLIYLVLPGTFERWILLDRRYITVMFLYLLSYPAVIMFQSKQKVAYKYKTSTAIGFSLLFLSMVCALLLVKHWQDNRLFGRIVGQYGPFIIAGAGFYLFYLYKGRGIHSKYWRYALRFGLPLVFHYLANHLLLTSDTIVVKHLSPENVGNLSIVHTASHIMLVLVQTLNSAWAPWMFDMLKQNRNGKIKKLFRFYLWGIIIVTFCVLLIGPELILLLGGETYMEALDILPAYILGGVFAVLTALFVNLETYHKKPEYAAVLTGAAALLNIILDIIGVKLWGYQGVSYATAMCQVLLIIAHYFLDIRMGGGEILPSRELAWALLATLMIIPAELLIYQNRLVRYGIVSLFGATAIVLLIVHRKALSSMLSRLKKQDESAEPEAD